MEKPDYNVFDDKSSHFVSPHCGDKRMV